MNVLEMSKFGRILTDREYGKSIASQILSEQTFPIALDFRGVISLGSSCGDEILNAIGPRQQQRIEVSNANQAVRSCLEKVAEDSRITITFR